jgi:hypothetical protein
MGRPAYGGRTACESCKSIDLRRWRRGALLEGAALAGVTPKSNEGRNNHMDAIMFSPTLAKARNYFEAAEQLDKVFQD